ncbi:hypothetical protein HanPSC8_Chr17g0787081 [Helianthus annuus]|nr:hypothetical protein HanPSC8_Chr17g0787081 [Helianthus annuus]
MIIIDFGKTMGCGLGKPIGDRCRRLKMKKVDIFKKSLSSLVLVLKRPSQL